MFSTVQRRNIWPNSVKSVVTIHCDLRTCVRTTLYHEHTNPWPTVHFPLRDLLHRTLCWSNFVAHPCTYSSFCSRLKTFWFSKFYSNRHCILLTVFLANVNSRGVARNLFLGGYEFLLHNTTVLYNSSLTSSAAISAQNNFQGLIFGGYIYWYRPTHRRYAPGELTFTFAICCRPSVCRLSVCLCRL